MKIAHNCDFCTCSLYQYCEEKNKAEFNRKKQVVHYKKGETIIRAGFLVDGFYILKSGYVKVMKKGYGKRKQTFRLCKHGDILGHRALNRDYFPVDDVALTDATLCFFTIDYFYELLEKNPRLTYNMLMFMADELYTSEKNARNCSLMNVRELVASALLYIDKVYGQEANPPILSRSDIAELATTTKEQVSKYLSEFQKDGIIDLKSKRIILLNKSKLEKIVEKYI